MKKEVADQWVTALRSGEYEQGKFFLKSEYAKFCCLGVLCEISKLGSWSKGTRGGAYVFSDPSDHTTQSALTCMVRDWAGMASIAGDLTSDMNLASLNDGGKSFAEIADVIEANWEVL